MPDITDAITRSRMMRGIKGKNTKPEISVRHALFERGFRYRLHAKELSGRPDIVLPKWYAVVFVHGCFWHLHEGCSNAKLPETRRDFWTSKLVGNKLRDESHTQSLIAKGWRVAIVWECSVRKMLSASDFSLIDSLSDWLKYDSASFLEL